jgi:hypothetical protein
MGQVLLGAEISAVAATGVSSGSRHAPLSLSPSSPSAACATEGEAEKSGPQSRSAAWAPSRTTRVSFARVRLGTVVRTA